MLIAGLQAPSLSNQGDFWFSYATRDLYEFHNSYNPMGYMGWVPVSAGRYTSTNPPPFLANTTGPSDPIWINSADPDKIPHQWSVPSGAWIPIVSPTFRLPPLNPKVGDSWYDASNGTQYTFAGSTWVIQGIQVISGALSQPRPPYQISNNNPGYTLTSNGQGIPPTWTAPAPAQNGFINYAGANNTTQPMLSVSQSALKINGLVEIFMDGSIVYESGYTPDATAKAMWEAIAHFSPVQLENKELTKLRGEVEKLRWILQLHADAGHQLPSPKCAPDPDAAWNAAMGVII